MFTCLSGLAVAAWKHAMVAYDEQVHQALHQAELAALAIPLWTECRQA